MPIMTKLENIFEWAHGHEPYATAVDHQEHAHQVTGLSNHFNFRNNQQKSEVLQPANIQRVGPNQDKFKLFLNEKLKSLGVALMRETFMHDIEETLAKAYILGFLFSQTRAS